MRLPLPCGSPVRSAAPRAKAPTGRDDAAATEIAEATNCLRETFPFSPMTRHLAKGTTVLQSKRALSAQTSCVLRWQRCERIAKAGRDAAEAGVSTPCESVPAANQPLPRSSVSPAFRHGESSIHVHGDHGDGVFWKSDDKRRIRSDTARVDLHEVGMSEVVRCRQFSAVHGLDPRLLCDINARERYTQGNSLRGIGVHDLGKKLLGRAAHNGIDDRNVFAFQAGIEGRSAHRTAQTLSPET